MLEEFPVGLVPYPCPCGKAAGGVLHVHVDRPPRNVAVPGQHYCHAIAATLRIEGQGVKSYKPGRLEAQGGMVYEGNIEYIGCIGAEERAREMGHAKAVFVPSEYAEPFGNVAVEAQICGAPVITTDFGAFPETVEHGCNGWRCRTLDHFIWAAENLRQFDPAHNSQRAASLYSMEAVKPRYREYFEMLSDLWKDGWSADNLGRQGLGWLT
jgi:glycosyltransferase involved in cell wall biosynthesis